MRAGPRQRGRQRATRYTFSRDAFRFSPELFELRTAVISELRERGIEWLSHYSAVDVMHDLYGIPVCGIHKEDDASRILDVLRKMFLAWKIIPR
jgi:hypothetical protein